MCVCVRVRACVYVLQILEPDLVSIGEHCDVQHESRFGTATIRDGYLIVERIKVGARCRISPRTMLVQGTALADGTETCAMASSCGTLGVWPLWE